MYHKNYYYASLNVLESSFQIKKNLWPYPADEYLKRFVAAKRKGPNFMTFFVIFFA